MTIEDLRCVCFNTLDRTRDATNRRYNYKTQFKIEL